MHMAGLIDGDYPLRSCTPMIKDVEQFGNQQTVMKAVRMNVEWCTSPALLFKPWPHDRDQKMRGCGRS